MTDPTLNTVVLVLAGAAKGALDHLTTTPPGALHRYRSLAIATAAGAALALAGTVTL